MIWLPDNTSYKPLIGVALILMLAVSGILMDKAAFNCLISASFADTAEMDVIETANNMSVDVIKDFIKRFSKRYSAQIDPAKYK